MRLSSLKTELAKMKEEVCIKLDSSIRFTRDKEANLRIYSANDPAFNPIPMFPFRPYQLEVQKELFINGKKRIVLVWPRRAGKEAFTFNMIVQAALTKPGLYLMVYPSNVRARKVLWQGSILLPDQSSLKFLDMIPPQFVIGKPNKVDMTIELNNGSVIWVLGSDVDPDKLRGTNPLGIVYSEFAYSDPRVFHVMLPALRQNGGWAIIQSTYNGMNHMYRLVQENKTNPDWVCKVESVTSLVDEYGERYITDAMIEEDRRAGMPEYLIQQEYFSAVQINQETMYFAIAIANLYATGRIISELILPTAPVYSFWDIGLDDETAICLVQFDHLGNPIVIGYIEKNNQGLKYYVDEIKMFCAHHNLLCHSHYVPHDGQKRDFNTTKNTVDQGRDMGEQFIVIKRPPSKINAIEAIRQLLYRTKFNKENTARLIDALSNYSKVYDQKLGVYKNEPLHNWASHPTDSFQTLALALETEAIIRISKHEVCYYNT